MKNILILSLAVILCTVACKKEDPEPVTTTTTTTTTPTPTPQSVTYWGCWREANSTPGVYDIILIENTTEPHTFQLGNSCIQEPAIPSQDMGVFRNDTLILNNGVYEFWCFIVNDTMLYSAYAPNATTERFIKI